MSDGEKDLDLTPEERRALEALARERAPRPELERSTVAALRQAGLVTGRRPADWQRTLLVAAASLLLLTVGFTAGRLPLGNGTVPTAEDAERYLLVLYRSPDELTDPEGEPQRVQEYSAWARDLAERGHLLGGEPLSSEGQLLIPTAGGVEKLPQTSLAGEEPMTGYFLISARSLAEAESIARDCPHLDHGGRVMMRRIGH